MPIAVLRPTVTVQGPNGGEIEAEVEVELTIDDLPDDFLHFMRQTHRCINDALLECSKDELYDVRTYFESMLTELGLNVTEERARNWPGYADKVEERMHDANLN